MRLFPQRLTRRHFLLGSGLFGLGYMRFVEAQWLSVGRHACKLTREASGNALTVLQLSDFHASKVVSLGYVNRAVTHALASCQPDLVCLTGDFITSRWEEWDAYSRILGRLSEVAPTVAVLGNHDAGEWTVQHCGGYEDHGPVESMLARAGIRMLHNSRMLLEARGWRLNVVGLGDSWADEMEPDDAFRGLDPTLPTLLLSHNPDTKDALRAYRWDLMLCGHTHGGQLDLPGIGTPFAPVQDHRYVAGLKPWEGRWIHVSKGVGNLHGMRFNCRPEISVLTLT